VSIVASCREGTLGGNNWKDIDDVFIKVHSWLCAPINEATVLGFDKIDGQFPEGAVVNGSRVIIKLGQFRESKTDVKSATVHGKDQFSQYAPLVEALFQLKLVLHK
jgi:hypothetical protein